MTRITQRRRVTLGFSLLMLGALMAPLAHAGQVRVNVGSNFFAPRYLNLNEGDHAVWVWVGGSHTVTSGDTLAEMPDGLFASGFASANVRFSWKSSPVGIHPYYCQPHASSGMYGIVQVHPRITPLTIPVADFRLTEVQFNVTNGLDLIEISNLGGADGDLQSFRLAVAATGTGVVISTTSFPVPAGGRVVIHTNETGTNNTPAGHIYTPALGPLNDVAGSLSLYVPSTVGSQSALNNSAFMLDFVQWGAGGQANEATAGSVNFWTAGQSIDGVADGHSIAYCANQTLDHGIDRWAEISPPSFGDLNDCNTPVLSQTWGYLKAIYRP